jgi:hypothetical protein
MRHEYYVKDFDTNPGTATHWLNVKADEGWEAREYVSGCRIAEVDCGNEETKVTTQGGQLRMRLQQETQWRSEPPTSRGIYWNRYGGEYCLVEVIPEEGQVRDVRTRTLAVKSLGDFGGEWYGPIMPPD